MDNIKILTWNICWKIMRDSKIAKNNVLDIIKELKDKSYDFIALQEASYIYTDLDKNKYDYIITTNKGKLNKENKDSNTFNTLITLYDKTKYRVKTYFGNEIINKRDKRPYHIIYFINRSNNEKFLFINFHNSHFVDLDSLQKNLSEKINNFIKEKNINNKISNIIICADWNYDYKELLLNINDTKKKIGNNNIPKPQTCCHKENKLLEQNIKTPMSRPGDYIFFSDNFDVQINNKLYKINTTKKYSDHLPVHTILQYKGKILVIQKIPATQSIVSLKKNLDIYFEKIRNLIIKKIDK